MSSKLEKYIEENRDRITKEVQTQIDKMSIFDKMSKAFGFSAGHEEFSVALKYHKDKSGVEFTSNPVAGSAYYWGFMFMGMLYATSNGNSDICKTILQDCIEMLALLEENREEYEKTNVISFKGKESEAYTQLIIATIGQIIQTRHLFNEKFEAIDKLLKDK